MLEVNEGTLALTGVTLTGGKNTDDDLGGGGLKNYQGTVRLTDSIVTANTAAVGDDGTSNGGGIYNFQGTMALVRTTVSNNTATDPDSFWPARGGGIYSYEGDVKLTDSTVTGNQSLSEGGGIANDYGALTLTGTTVSNNAVTLKYGTGGGIWSLASLTVRRSIIADNTAFKIGGIHMVLASNTLTISDGSIVRGNAGPAIFAAGSVKISDSTITANESTDPLGTSGMFVGQALSMNNSKVIDNLQAGAAVDCGESACQVTDSVFTGNRSSALRAISSRSTPPTLTITGTAIRGNRGYDAGGVYAKGYPVTAIGSTVTGNQAQVDGGGFNLSLAHLTLRDSTVTANTSATKRAGGIYLKNGNDITVENSTIADNTPENCATYDENPCRN